MTDEFNPDRPGPPREVSEDAAARELMTAEDRASEISTQIVTDVSELADRTSPDNRPWELTVTADELALIAARAAVTALRAHAEQARAEGKTEERENLANWMLQHSFATGNGDSIEDLLSELSWQVNEIRQRNETPND